MSKKMRCFQESISRYSIVVMYNGAVEKEEEEDEIGDAYQIAGELEVLNPGAEIVIYDRFENRQIEP